MPPASLLIEPSLLRQYRYFESDDVDDTCARIATVLQPHRLTPGASRVGYSAYMNYVRIDSVRFGTIRYACAMGVDAGEIADYYLAILDLSGYADLTVGGRRTIVSQTQGVIVGPSTRFGGTFSGDCEQFFFSATVKSPRNSSGCSSRCCSPANRITASRGLRRPRSHRVP
jgi:hypothetical protein